MLEADEKRLLEYTIELKQQYVRLSEIVDSLAKESSRTIDPIREQMKRIKEIETSLAPLRDAYLRQNDHASGEIARVTDETIELVKALMPKLASLEKTSVESLRRLFPKVQDSVRAVQMQNAYRGNQYA